MNLNKQKILQIAEKVVEEADFFLIAIEYRGDNRNQIIEIFVDNVSGFSAEDCKIISKKISTVFEEQDLIKGNKYRLDVSSPGIDRPLKFFGQYSKHLNRKFALEYYDGEEILKIESKLAGIENNDFIFSRNNKEVKINFNNIKSAKVLLSFK